MDISKPILIPSLLAGLGVCVTMVHASPNGKPFVELEGQIVEVQGAVASLQEQIDDLVGDVETMEQRLDGDAAAITQLEAEIDTLTASIEANEGDIEALAGQVDHNIDLIEGLQEEMAMLAEAVALKQDLLDGNCPEGSALQEIQADGSIVCETISGGALGQVVVQQGTYVARWRAGAVYVDCPQGYTVTGGGYYNAGVRIDATIPALYRGQSWMVRAYNGNYYSTWLEGYAVCAAIL